MLAVSPPLAQHQLADGQIEPFDVSGVDPLTRRRQFGLNLSQGAKDGPFGDRYYLNNFLI